MPVFEIPYTFEATGVAKAFVRADSSDEAWNKFMNDDFEVPFGAEDVSYTEGDLRRVSSSDKTAVRFTEYSKLAELDGWMEWDADKKEWKTK
jgi:hypothetical protein